MIGYNKKRINEIENDFSNLNYSNFYSVESYTKKLNSKFQFDKIYSNIKQSELKEVLKEFSKIYKNTQNYYGVNAFELIEKVGKETLTNAITTYYEINDFFRNNSRIIKANKIQESLEYNITSKKEYFLGHLMYNNKLIVFPRKVPKIHIFGQTNYEQKHFGLNIDNLRSGGQGNVYIEGLPKVDSTSLV